MKLDEKLKFITHHPSLTCGLYPVKIVSSVYNEFCNVDLIYTKFDEEYIDENFIESKISHTSKTYSKAIDDLYYIILNQYGHYVDYDYSDKLYNIARIETYKKVQLKIQNFIEKLEKNID